MLAEASKYSAQLGALAKVPKSVYAFLAAYSTAVVNAKAPAQWKHWYWICFGGFIFFLLAIPLKGRWSPKAAKADEEAHEAMVEAELEKLNS